MDCLPAPECAALCEKRPELLPVDVLLERTVQYSPSANAFEVREHQEPHHHCLDAICFSGSLGPLLGDLQIPSVTRLADGDVGSIEHCQKVIETASRQVELVGSAAPLLAVVITPPTPEATPVLCLLPATA